MPSQWFAERLASRGIPQADRLVPTPARHRLAVLAEGDTIDRAFMPSQWFAERLAGRGIPQADRLVQAPTRERLAVWAEGDTGDRAFVPSQWFADGLVAPGGRQQHRETLAEAEFVQHRQIAAGTNDFPTPHCVQRLARNDYPEQIITAFELRGRSCTTRHRFLPCCVS